MPKEFKTIYLLWSKKYTYARYVFFRDFTVRYRVFDDYGQETYLSLLSDWDLDAAFLRYVLNVDLGLPMFYCFLTNKLGLRN